MGKEETQHAINLALQDPAEVPTSSNEKRVACHVLLWTESHHICAGGSSKPSTHALGKDEIVATVDVLKAQGKITESTRFPLIELHEPPKDI